MTLQFCIQQQGNIHAFTAITPNAVQPKPMEQSGSLWQLFCQFGSQRQQSSMGLPERHAGWLSFAWRDSICLCDRERAIDTTAKKKKELRKGKGETERERN